MIDITGLREDKRPQSSTIVHALLDRLEAAEKSVALKEQAIDVLGAAAKAEIERLRADATYWQNQSGEHTQYVAQLVAEVESLKERLEAAEQSDAESIAMWRKARDERDELRAKIAEMERQEPVAKVRVHQTGGNAGISWSVAPLNDFDALPLMRDGSKLYALPGAQAQPAQSVPECPYPCGWQNLLKHAIEDGAYLARSINEDEPVTKNVRSVVMLMVMRLRDVLMTINKAAPEAKP